MDREMLNTASDLGEIIRLHNEAVERIKAYREARPYIIAPNLVSMLDGNLKDNIEVLYRELNNIAKPKGSTQRRHVCKMCHSVFLQSLPGGVCDECRSRSAPGAGRYSGGTHVQYDPRAESDDSTGAIPASAEVSEVGAEEQSEASAEA